MRWCAACDFVAVKTKWRLLRGAQERTPADVDKVAAQAMRNDFLVCFAKHEVFCCANDFVVGCPLATA